MAKKSGSLRDKYANRSVNVKALKDKKDQEDRDNGYSGSSNYHILEDGKTMKFRICPPHSEDAESFYKMRKKYWLTIEEDGEEKRRTVFDSRTHGGTAKDIVDEYIKAVKKYSDFKDIDDWKKGLRPEIVWCCYAFQIGKDFHKLAELEMKKTVRDAINKEMFVEDDDEEIEIDPFTDIEDGLPILIKYNSKPNKKKGEDFYEITTKKQSIPLTDEDLEAFDKVKTLEELYDNIYSQRDFETALAGLQHYDEVNGISLFEDDRWLDIVEDVKSQYSFSDDEDEDEDEKPAKKSAKKTPTKKKPVVVEEDEDEEEEEEDEDEEEEEEPAPKKKVVKKPAKKVVEEEEDDDDDDDEDDDDDDDEEEEEETKKPKKTLDDIRNRLKNKKKIKGF